MSRTFYLSLALLDKHGACESGKNDFRRFLGEGDVLVTQEVARKIGRAGYADWVVDRMQLSAGQRQRNDEAWARYFGTPNDTPAERRALKAIDALQVALIAEGPGAAK